MGAKGGDWEARSVPAGLHLSLEELPRMQSRNFAARAGRWSAQHRKKAILGWFAFVIIATVLGGMVGTKTLADEDTGNGESKRADQIVEAADFPEQTGETILVQGKDGLKVGDPEVHRRRRTTSSPSSSRPRASRRSRARSIHRTRATSPTTAAPCSSTSSCPATRTRPRTSSTGRSPPSTQLQKQHPEVQLGEFGDASAEKEIGEAFEEDFQKAEFLSLPITLIILLIAFGALVAAGLPLLLGATAVMGTIGLLGPISQLHALEESSSSVVLLVGLAVGVDYCMFYLRREMEERDAGRSPEAALNAAAATSGRAVLVSGLDRDGRDGRHVPRRQRRLRLVRHRHDARRRGRDARLGHRAPRDALVPLAQGLDREGPRAVGRQAAPQDARRVEGLGRDPRPRAQAPAGLGDRGRRAAASR